MLFTLEPDALEAIAKNMSCLYALVGVRLDDQRFRAAFINTASPRFVLRNPSAQKPSNIWVSKKKPIMESLIVTSPSEVSDSFAAPAPNDVKEDLRRIKNTFGQAVYELVATNKAKWQSSDKQYIGLRKRYKHYSSVAGAPMCQLDVKCPQVLSCYLLHHMPMFVWVTLACLQTSLSSSHVQI